MDFNMILNTELGTFIYGKSWLEYQDKLEKFFDLHDIYDNEIKKCVCLTMMDIKSLEIVQTLISPQNIEDVDYKTVLEKLESHYYPTVTEGHYIYKFIQRKQKKLENFFEYVHALRKLIIHCAFEDPKVRLKRQIIAGIRDEDLREKFFEATSQTLTQIFEIGLAYDDAGARTRYHGAQVNRDRLCFCCKESILKHYKDESCPFEWAECEHCHTIGHLTIACNYKYVLCNYCSQIGHVTKICVRKMEDSKGPRQIIVSMTLQALENENKETKKLITVSNLRISTTEDELRNYFAKYGKLQSLKMEHDSVTNNFNGIAHISYKQSESYTNVLLAKQHML